VLPSETIASMANATKRNARTLTKLCTFAQLYFDPQEIPAMLEEFLPYFSNSFTENSFVVVGLLNLLLPTSPAPEGRPELQPQHYLPTLFHLWSLMNRSRQFDVQFVDILSRLARDTLSSKHVPWSPYGIFTQEQSATIFTAILRVLEIPVGQSTAAYSSSVDAYTGLAVILDRDQRKHPIAHHIARWIVMSLSPECLKRKDSVLANLEGLIQAVETFFHPSNSGNWTRTLSQLVYYLADFFVMRWNRERSGEMEVPEERKLNDEVKRRFVLCLREVIFMGIYAKSGTAMNFSLSTLQSLAYLEPDLILPGALQRIYPSMQGLVEVHRTISSIRSLQMLAKVMSRTKGYRCHITTLLGLALPGIDANDLDKTFYTLSFIQSVAYNVPFHDLTKEKVRDDSRSEEEDYDMISRGSAMSGTHTPSETIADTGLAMRWITEQVDRLEREGANIELNYGEELRDGDEQAILQSSTTELAEFVTSFLGRVFTLLENLPDASRVRSGSPEENVVNTLPATFTPLLASLSPELYDLALNKISHFVTTHVIHQARDAMAFICNALVKINPQKALRRLIPDLVQCIRTEIEFNGAGSSRTTGSEVVPKDRALVWNISLLSMCIVHVGDAVLEFQKELYDIADFMQQNCRGVPTVHVSNFIHHLLLNLTLTYTLDFSIYEPQDLARGLTAADWGRYTDPQKISVKWHTPSPEEVRFAIALFKKQGHNAIKTLRALISKNPPVKRDGTGRDWSDEVSRNLTLLRLIISGVSVLFDPRYQESKDGEPEEKVDPSDLDQMFNKMDSVSMTDDDDDAELTLGDADDEDGRLVFSYPTGYPIEKGSDEYEEVHQMRNIAGQVLHNVHEYFANKQQDDVQCFNALYNAYRAWFVDVGIERSAHVLDRVTRLLAADIQPYKFSGLRKEYPRPLVVRRANVYHLQRLRHNAVPREKDELQVQMLLDLAESSVSIYTEIRRTAQGAIESAVKCVIGARPLVIPPLLKRLEESVKKKDFPVIKGCMFSLLFGSLAKTIARDWRYTPRLIKIFVEATTADKQSIQKLVANALFQIMDMGKPLDRMVILDEDVIESIAPDLPDDEEEAVQEKITNRGAFIKRRRNRVENKKAELCHDLIDVIKGSHWKQAQRTAAIVVNLGMRFDNVAPQELIDLIVNGAIDPHPSLRVLWHGALNGLFSILSARSLCHHDYKKYLLMQEELPDKIYVEVDLDDDDWTENYLKSFAHADAKYFVDYDYPGWLVWKDKFPAFLTESGKMDYDEVEMGVRTQVGKVMNRHWFSTFFAYMKQEPRDSSADRFRMGNALMLTHAFDLVFAGTAAATFEDIKDLTQAVYGDGSDKHEHRATAEIMGALLACSSDLRKEQRIQVWEYVFPVIRGLFQDNLTPENSSYWQTFLHMVTQAKDPRRAWPLIDWLASFRLDMNSSAAFKESSKINLLYQAILEAGWHFQLGEPILEDFMKHLDHPYKSVREAMGVTLAAIYRTRYHESYDDVDTLIQAQKVAGSLGVKPYDPTEEFTDMINGTLERLEKWRLERTPGQQTPTPYTQAGKTILLMLDSMLSSYECTQLNKFFPGPLLEQLLHMMDIKEDPELQGLAYHVFRHMPNVPHRAGEDSGFIDALIKIGRGGDAWHQRLRVLICIQIIYFRRLFLIEPEQQKRLFDCVSSMLADNQLEVRLGASTTLAGMVRCSPIDLRNKVVKDLKSRFTDMLIKNPLPKKKGHNRLLSTSSTNNGEGPRVSTPTPEQTKLTLTRHAAVLGLGALVSAFPYTSPPPAWLPDVLATLALKGASDSGVVGKGVKQILAEFKKTRQDTWHIDVKVSSDLFATDLYELTRDTGIRARAA
jgi:proteasome activator subunit 4